VCWPQTTNNETVKKQFSSLKISIRCGCSFYMSSSSHVGRMYTCIFHLFDVQKVGGICAPSAYSESIVNKRKLVQLCCL
jgi:hypothetical protein